MPALLDWFLWLIFIPTYCAKLAFSYLQSFAVSARRKMQLKYVTLRKKYQRWKLSNIEHKARTALSNGKYRDALRFYAAKLEKISEIANTTQELSPKELLNLKYSNLFSISAVYAEMDSWLPSVDICVDALRGDPTNTSTKALFQMLHSTLSAERGSKLLTLLAEDPRCDEINESATFNLMAIRSYCPQRGKCCAAAVAAAGLNAILKQNELTTDDGLNEYIALFPKYAPRLKRRNTRNIGNGNLKQCIKSLAERRFKMSIEFETLISGPRCKKGKGFYTVTKAELNKGDLCRYAELLRSYLESEHHVLIAHIKNHYSLVFGMRQNSSTKQTDVLISKRGQSPKHWEPLSLLLMCFAKSKIYKLYAAKQLKWVH